MKHNPLPSQELLRTLFDYSAEDGALTWRRRDGARWSGWNTRYAGTSAGTPDKDGYRIVRIAKQPFRAVRVIWMWEYGEDPGEDQIDHANGKVADDRKDNLRRATDDQNAANNGGWRRKALPLGVHLRCDGEKFVAKIMINRKTKSLGSFETPEAAHRAYVTAAKEARGSFARVQQ